LSEISAPAAGGPVATGPQSFQPKSALKSVLTSILVNAVLPFVLYNVLEPLFPAHSVMPLLYACAFPVLGLAVGLIRTRSVDAIAVIVLFGLVYSVVSTLLAGEIRRAMIWGATQGFVIGAIFLATVFFGKPILFFIVRQFAAGNDPQARARFGTVNEKDGWRTMRIATLVWTAGIFVMSILSIVLARTLPPATYLLANNIINIAVNLALVAWSTQFIRPRLMRVAEAAGMIPTQS